MEVAGIFVALASEGLIVFFLFHFYVNVFSITGKWEKTYNKPSPHARGR